MTTTKLVNPSQLDAEMGGGGIVGTDVRSGQTTVIAFDTATGIRYCSTIWDASTPKVVAASTLATANLTTATITANTDALWEIEGLIRCNTAGTLIVEYASEAGSGTVTIQPDSFLQATELT